jgi:dolichyl-diphosphooligosaccharide--protein glycosyltransferase
MAVAVAGRRRSWYVVTGAAAVLALFERAKIGGAIAEISRFLPWHSGNTTVDEVKELVPIWRAAPGVFGPVFYQFGAAWVFALAGLGAVVWMMWRGRRPALTLFMVWSVTMIVGVVLQARMAAYTSIVVAILAGVSSAWIVERIPSHLPSLRGGTAAILILLGMAITVPVGVGQIGISGGPDPDWWDAMDWLRANSPEPMGEASAWYRLWPAVRPGQTFRYPDSAYSIIVPWDKGSWVTAIARRIPAANGAADSAPETARFLTDTLPEEAARDAARIGARYAVTDPETVTLALPSMVRAAGRRIEEYSRVLHVVGDDGRDRRLRVYLPAFYRSMGARLYLFDGRRASSDGAQVFVTETGAGVERFVSVHRFGSEKEA